MKYSEIKCSPKHAMGFGVGAEVRQATSIDHRDTQSSVHEGLPPVGIEDDVADGSLAMDVGDSPVESHAIAGASFILAEWHARGSDEASVAGHDHSGVF